MSFITPTDMPVGGDIKINGFNQNIKDPRKSNWFLKNAMDSIKLKGT